jgi:hypothetical protein
MERGLRSAFNLFVDKRNRRAIANMRMAYYLVFPSNPARESIPLKYHDLIHRISV